MSSKNCCEIKANNFMIVYKHYLTYIHVTLEKLSYSRYSKILNIFLFLFSNNMFVIKAVIHILLVRIANNEDPD